MIDKVLWLRNKQLLVFLVTPSILPAVGDFWLPNFLVYRQ